MQCWGREWLGAVPPLPTSAFMAHSGTALALALLIIKVWFQSCVASVQYLDHALGMVYIYCSWLLLPHWGFYNGPLPQYGKKKEANLRLWDFCIHVIFLLMHCRCCSGWISPMGLVTLSSAGNVAVVVSLPLLGLTSLWWSIITMARRWSRSDCKGTAECITSESVNKDTENFCLTASLSSAALSPLKYLGFSLPQLRLQRQWSGSAVLKAAL